MSVSGISSTNPYANIFFDTTSQQRATTSLGGQSTGDTVRFSSEAIEMYQASKAEQQISNSASAQGEASEESLESIALEDEASGQETLTSQAVSGGMKGGKGKPSGGGASEEDDDDEDATITSWYDEWFESMYGETGATEDSFLTGFLEENK